MGLLNSKAFQTLQTAKNIRQQLYSRVQTKKNKYLTMFSSITNEKKIKILRSTASQLTQMMDSNQSTSIEILLCFIQRTINVGVQFNYVLDEMFQQALLQAMECDSIRRANPGKKCWREGMVRQDCFPPFYGVPASIKQSILMKGKQSYGGFVSKINLIPKQDPAYMELIRAMGLIPFVRSNVPQACRTVQTNNNMFGYCMNIRKNDRSCGGSSGGQGGLVGSLCSPIGIGSDIGGSLRIPAEFNGVFTIKPSRRNQRQTNAYYGKFSGGSSVIGQPGPLTHSTEDLKIYCEFMFNKANYQNINQNLIDPHLRLTSLQTTIFVQKPKLKIGIVPHLDTLKCSKSHERVIEQVERILGKLGHQTKKMTLPKFQDLYFFMVRLFTSDYDLSVMDQIRGNEPFTREYHLLHLITKIPWIIKKVIIWLIKKKQPRLVKLMQLTRPMTSKQLVEYTYDIQVKHARQVQAQFVDNQLDAIIMPGFAIPAFQHGSMAGLQYCLAFNTGWNVVHYPAGSLPVSLVRQGQEQYSDQFNDVYTKNIRKSLKDCKGLPVGIQVISLPQEQSKILYIMNQLQKQIKFNQKFPIPLKQLQS